MKKFLLMVLCLMAIIVASCNGKDKGNSIRTEKQEYADSSKFMNLKMSLEFPIAENAVSKLIRDSLAEIIDGEIGYIGYNDGTREIPAYNGDIYDLTQYIRYYGSALFDVMGKHAQNDYTDRFLYMEEDPDMTPEQIAEAQDNFPGWECDVNVSKTDETSNYIVFLSESYLYQGGAHGGVAGSGYLTFSKEDGHLIRDVILPNSEHDMQALLREGLLSYFHDQSEEITADDLNDYLLLEGAEIPLPAYTPHPTVEGLAFLYQQYEIAPYAAGMPSFVIPYDKVSRFMTETAKHCFLTTTPVKAKK